MKWKFISRQKPPREADPDKCLLCGKSRDAVKGKKLLNGVHGGVCAECIDLAYEILHRQQV